MACNTIEDSDKSDLRDLLSTWSESLVKYVDYLYDDNDINIKVLEVMEYYHFELLKNLNVGAQIVFQDKFKEWRMSIGMPCLTFPKGSTTAVVASKEKAIEWSANLETSKRRLQNEETVISVREILSETENGKALKGAYELVHRFTDQQRSMLIETIVNYYSTRKLGLSIKENDKIVEEIVEMFPTERSSLYSGNGNNRGKIYNKYQNLKKKWKPLNDILNCNNSSPTTPKSNKRKYGELVAEENADELLKLIKFSRLTAEEFDRCWQACREYRLLDMENLSLNEIFKKWPQYTSPKGDRLISIDFDGLNLEKDGSGLLDGWNLTTEAMSKILENHLKDGTVKKQMTFLQNSFLQENCRDSTLFWALHALLPPTAKKVNLNATGKKSTSKYTIADSQNSFVYLVSCTQEVDEHIAHLKTLEDPVQPFIICVGSNISNINDIIVFFHDHKFIFNTFLKAVDTCFKIFYVFQVEFPNASKVVWNFLAHFYYKTEYESYPRLEEVVDLLKNVNNSS